jgi:hypothetical protein
MSIARERREMAAALALLIRGKLISLDAALKRKDDDAIRDATVELALIHQNNVAFILWLLEHYAGSMKDLPGGVKRSSLVLSSSTDHETLGEAVQSDIKNGYYAED